jgi:Cu-processing system permease protein
MTQIFRIVRYVVRDLLRSRWLMAYAGFFAVATWTLLRFSDVEAKAVLSLVNVVLFIVPMATIVFAAMYLYSAREFVELLLAQPIRRRELFAGLFLGLITPLAAAAAVGLWTPLLAIGTSWDTVRALGALAAMAAVLSTIFTGIAAMVVYRVDDRVRGVAMALGLWLVLALVYDGVVLTLATQLAGHPLQRPLLALMLANPIDLGRLLLLFQFDNAALMGYTGVVFRRFFAGAFGAAVTVGAIGAWTLLPALAGSRLFRNKNF